MDEDLLPHRIFEVGLDGPPARGFELTRPGGNVAHPQGEVMETLAAPVQEIVEEPLRAHRLDELDDAATRKLKLRPTKTLGRFGRAHQVARPEHVPDERDHRRDPPGRNRDVVEPVGDAWSSA